jgi:hypothetical protein
MLAVPKLTLPRKKVSDAKRTPLYRPGIVPQYDGRWPFIGSAGNKPQDAFGHVSGVADAPNSRGQTVKVRSGEHGSLSRRRRSNL